MHRKRVPEYLRSTNRQRNLRPRGGPARGARYGGQLPIANRQSTTASSYPRSADQKIPGSLVGEGSASRSTIFRVTWWLVP